MKSLLRYITCALIACSLISGGPFVSTGWGRTSSSRLVSALVTEVRYNLNEKTADFWSDSELSAHVSEAVQNVQSRTRSIKASQTTTLTAGTTEYAISSNYITIEGVIYQSGLTEYIALLRGNRTLVGHLDADFEEPKYWYEENATVIVFPIMDTDDVTTTGNTIYITYIPMQAVLSSTSTIPTPASYDKAIIQYATGKALMKVPDSALSETFYNRYEAELDRFRIDFLDRPRDSFWDIIKPRVQNDNTR